MSTLKVPSESNRTDYKNASKPIVFQYLTLKYDKML